MILHLHELTVAHDRRTLVRAGDVRLDPGRALTLIGESGSGKSLVAHALMGTLPPELDVAGSMSIDGVATDVADQRARIPLWGRAIALLPQEPVLALDPTMRSQELVAEGSPLWRGDRPAARSDAAARLAELGVGHAASAYPHELSGGMAQRVAFAAATAGGAPVLIADEPSKGLDDRSRAALAALLLRHVQAGGALLTITHDLDLARALGGDVIVLSGAEEVERGPVDRVLSTPEHPFTRRLLAAEPRHWSKTWMRRGSSGDPDAAVIVRALGVSRALGGRSLFSGLDLDLRVGERLALTGPSGSGKTTLGRVLLRQHPVDSGRVSHMGLQRARGRAPVQQLFQDPAQSFPLHAPLGATFDDAIRRHGLSRARFTGLMADLALDGALLRRRPTAVSGGELQRLAIIRSIMLRPALLLADEPTSRLDLITQEETFDALMSQAESHEVAMLIVTHDRDLADAVADRSLDLVG